MQVIVTPITHEPPSDPAAALEIKPAIRRALGLDSTRQWLRFDELNRFDWPGFDLRPIPGRGDSWAYGMLPGAIYDELRRAILERQRARKVRASSR
ncbi:MAG TPA: hypothetical protein VGS12_06005 [Caulobacteraceae bacterium]|nr:hypothetical protein [Caulobacteraceae bacterium]